MKKLVDLAMSLTMAFSLVACGNSDASANAGTDTTATSAAATTTEAAQQTAPAEKQDVTLRMWGAEEDQPMLQGMIDSFKEHYADYANFDIQLGTESESTAKDTVLTDIEAAADVYSFASDQLFDLVNAGGSRITTSYFSPFSSSFGRRSKTSSQINFTESESPFKAALAVA